MNLTLEDKEYLKIFPAIEHLKESLSEKTKGSYLTIERRNPGNRDLVEAYLLLDLFKKKSGLLKKIFNLIAPPLQFKINSNKILAVIKHGRDEEYGLKTLIEIHAEDYFNLMEACNETCKKYGIN